MGTEIRIWQLQSGVLKEIQEDDLAAHHYEEDLEQWVANDTSLLGAKLLVVARQHDIPNVGCLDLLCIDETGTLVVVEFKRDLTRREAVAQILDYASWLDGATETELQACAAKYLDKPLSDAFAECFGAELQALTPQNHRMLLVAPKLDTAAERIIGYLSERHSMDINAVFFRYARTANGDEMLVRTILVPDTLRSHKTQVPTAANLLAVANAAGTAKLVDLCRRMGEIADLEEAATAYEGSFRYWLMRKMIFGVNVAGGRRKPGHGDLDVWIPVASLALTTGKSEQEIRQTLLKEFSAAESGKTDCVVRLSSPEAAQAIIARIKGWIGAKPAIVEQAS